MSRPSSEVIYPKRTRLIILQNMKREEKETRGCRCVVEAQPAGLDACLQRRVLGDRTPSHMNWSRLSDSSGLCWLSGGWATGIWLHGPGAVNPAVPAVRFHLFGEMDLNCLCERDDAKVKSHLPNQYLHHNFSSLRVTEV